MKSTKAIGLIFVVLAVLSLATIAFAQQSRNESQHQSQNEWQDESQDFFKNIELKYSTSLDPTSWYPVKHGYGDSKFKLKLDPTVEWYYLDVASLKPMSPIKDGLYGFNVTTPYPDGYFEYWDSRGVNSSAVGWQGIMWQIINGNLPIFYLQVVGTDYMLVDGLQYTASGGTLLAPLRVNGTYLTGTYSYLGSLSSGTATYSIAVQIVFK